MTDQSLNKLEALNTSLQFKRIRLIRNMNKVDQRTSHTRHMSGSIAVLVVDNDRSEVQQAVQKATTQHSLDR